MSRIPRTSVTKCSPSINSCLIPSSGNCRKSSWVSFTERGGVERSARYARRRSPRKSCGSRPAMIAPKTVNRDTARIATSRNIRRVTHSAIADSALLVELNSVGERVSRARPAS